MMDRIERQMLLVTRAAAVLGVLFLLLVAALSVLDILVREIQGRPIRGTGDLARLLTIIIVSACFPAGLLERRQIKVALLGSLLPAWANRVLEVFGALLTCLMFAFIAYYVTLHAQRVSASNEYTMILNWPIAPWWWAASLCFWACLPAQIFVILAEALGRPAIATED
jgi:TRAP-type transport system small permease protein